MVLPSLCMSRVSNSNPLSVFRSEVSPLRMWRWPFLRAPNVEGASFSFQETFWFSFLNISAPSVGIQAARIPVVISAITRSELSRAQYVKSLDGHTIVWTSLPRFIETVLQRRDQFKTYHDSREWGERESTYNKPTAKAPVIPHFLLRDMRSPHITGSGRNTTHRSTTILNMADAYSILTTSPQTPGPVGSQL